MAGSPLLQKADMISSLPQTSDANRFPAVTYLHLIIGLLLGGWVYAFLVLIGPFDTYPLSIEWRAQTMSGYGLCMVLSYYAILPLQKWLLRLRKSWPLSFELIVTALVFCICFLPTFAYYKSPIIRGTFSLRVYAFHVYFPTIFILWPLMLMLREGIRRWHVHTRPGPSPKIRLAGDTQSDLLQLSRNDLICIKSAGNYVEVYFQQGPHLQKKLLRTSSKNIRSQVPGLVQVHRSWAINPLHFVQWKGSKCLVLTKLEVPVSATYRKELVERPAFRP